MFKRLLPLLALLPGFVHSEVIPFTLDGALDSATADNDDYNTGGRISVNGVNIVVPKNLQFQFPAAWVGMKDIVAGQFTGNEVTVYGNYVDGEARAGIVQIAQYALEFNSGKIKSLDFDGKITLEGGQAVRINDPNAVFSAGYKLHPFFTADDVNPSVTAFSGFPMCVPRSANDDLCPSSNRPSGTTSFNAPDPLIMSPLKPGDYVEIEGIKVGSEIIAYGIVVPSVQILTPNGPTYVRIEEALIGVFDTQSANIVEFADSRVIGYTSTAGGSVTISRSEIDPCTGKINDVTVGPASNPSAPRNKWTWRVGSTSSVKYAREYKATSSNGVVQTKNNITAGQYIAPIAEWIFPEVSLPGSQPGKNDFTQMTWLTNGLGPDANGNIWGPLSPWPDTTAPAAPKACTAAPPTSSTTASSSVSEAATATNSAPASSGTADVTQATPTANAGPDLKIRPNNTATLVGKADNATSFPVGDLIYNWTQIAGAAVQLTDANTATAKFIVPLATSNLSYTFELTVTSSSSGTQSKDTVVVGNGVDTVTVTAYTWTNQNGGTLGVTAQSSVTDGTAKLTLQLLNPNAGTALVMTSAGGGKFTYSARSTKQPSQGVRVTSSIGGVGNRATPNASKIKRWHARFFPLS